MFGRISFLVENQGPFGNLAIPILEKDVTVTMYIASLTQKSQNRTRKEQKQNNLVQ